MFKNKELIKDLENQIEEKEKMKMREEKAYNDKLNETKYDDKNKFGTCLVVPAQYGFPTFVYCFICKSRYRVDKNPDTLDYDALKSCLEIVNKNFVDLRNQMMALLNTESSLMEIVKLIGSDVLPDDQKLILEIARVIRLGFLQQNAFHKDDTCVPMEKQYKMMEIILYLYKKSRALVTMGMPMSVLKEDTIFEKIIAIKYDVPNDKLEMFDDYKKAVDEYYNKVLEKNA